MPNLMVSYVHVCSYFTHCDVVHVIYGLNLLTGGNLFCFFFTVFRHLWTSFHGDCKRSTRAEASSSRWAHIRKHHLPAPLLITQAHKHTLIHAPSQFPCFLTPQSVLPFFVATKMSKIRRPTLTAPSAERYVSAELNTVGLQTQTNGYLPHAVMVRTVYALIISIWEVVGTLYDVSLV